MYRVLQGAAVACLLAIAALCGFGCWALRAAVNEERALRQSTQQQLAAVEAATVTNEAQLTASVSSVAGAVNGALGEVADRAKESKAAVADLDRAAAGLNQATALLTAPCDAPSELNYAAVNGTGRPCGTIADVNRTLGSFRLAAGQVTAFSLKEQTKLDQANAQETAIAKVTQDDLTKLGSAIDDIGALAADEDLKKSLGNLNTTSGAIAGMATDTQQYWHGVLHPKWPRRVWNGVTGVGIAAAKFFIP